MNEVCDVLAAALVSYGPESFVWPAYGVAAVVLVGLWIMSQRRRRAAERMARDLEPGKRGEAS